MGRKIVMYLSLIVYIGSLILALNTPVLLGLALISGSICYACSES